MTHRVDDDNRLVVFCAGNPWNGQRLPDQHVAERLTRYAPVLYVDPPVSRLSPRRDPFAAAALEQPRLRPIHSRLIRLTTLAPPGRTRPLVRSIAAATARRSIRRAVREMDAQVQVTIVASLSPMLGMFPASRKVLYATDDFVAGAHLMGLGQAAVERSQRRAMRQADLVIVVSNQLAESLRGFGIEPTVVENGVDFELFADDRTGELPREVRLPPPIAGFVGNISDRIDFSLLEAVADRGSSLLLVGRRARTADEDRVEALIRRPNVQWVDYQPFEALPGWLRSMKVGLVPYRVDEFNRASSPLKVLEYFASGIDTVSTSLPAVVALGSLVRFADAPNTFAEEVDRALREPSTADLVAARRLVAKSRSWDTAVDDFAAAIGLVAH